MAAIRLRLLTAADLPFADAIRNLAGWNQTLPDWRRFLSLEPEGCFLAEWEGTPAGTATTLKHGPDLAWIGMVLVRPELRRRGVGRALLEHCLDYLRQRGIRGVKLDATPLGRPVYAALGFAEEWTLTRWQRDAPYAFRTSAGSMPATFAAIDLAAVREIDTAAFGTPRDRLLRALLSDSTVTVACADESGAATGYAMLRPGARAHYLGPVVADEPAVGIALIEEVLRRASLGRVFWDIPDANTAAVAWAREHGFEPQRSLVRMCRGPSPAPGNPAYQFALTGPETG